MAPQKRNVVKMVNNGKDTITNKNAIVGPRTTVLATCMQKGSTGVQSQATVHTYQRTPCSRIHCTFSCSTVVTTIWPTQSHCESVFIQRLAFCATIVVYKETVQLQKSRESCVCNTMVHQRVFKQMYTVQLRFNN